MVQPFCSFSFDIYVHSVFSCDAFSLTPYFPILRPVLLHWSSFWTISYSLTVLSLFEFYNKSCDCSLSLSISKLDLSSSKWYGGCGPTSPIPTPTLTPLLKKSCEPKKLNFEKKNIHWETLKNGRRGTFYSIHYLPSSEEKICSAS